MKIKITPVSYFTYNCSLLKTFCLKQTADIVPQKFYTMELFTK